MKEVKLVEVEEVEEWEVDKILNKRGIVKYLIRQKKFIAEYNIQKKEKNIENTKEVIAEFEEDIMKEREFRKRKLLEKYTVKILYGQNNKKLKKEYLRRLERNWQK